MKKEEMKKSGCHLVARLFFCTFDLRSKILSLDKKNIKIKFLFCFVLAYSYLCKHNKIRNYQINGRRNKGRNDGAEH